MGPSDRHAVMQLAALMTGRDEPEEAPAAAWGTDGGASDAPARA